MPGSATLSIRMVFSSKSYVALTAVIAVAFWIIFNIFDGLLFFSPFVDFFYPIPEDALPGFILSNITAAFVGIIVSMNVYMIRKFASLKSSGPSFLSGTSIGTLSSMCVGCSSVGFYLATTFGTAGVAASAIMSNYELPMRLVTVGLLVWAYYSAHRRITSSCALE